MSSRTNRNTLLLMSVFLPAMVCTTFAGPLLFPFQAGVRYEYKRWDSADPVNQWTVQMEFDHAKIINDFTYFHLQRWNYENDSVFEDMGYVRLTEQAAYEYNPTPGEEDYVVHQKAPIGTKWHYPLEEGDYLVREIIAIEPVMVPYGHFDQAYVQRVYTCMDPDDLNKGKSTDWYEWTVPGIGFVKQVNDWVDNPPATLELVRVLHEPEATIVLEEYFPLGEGITWNYLQTYQDGRRDYEIYCIGGTEAVDGEQTIKHWEFDSGELDYGLIYAYDCMAWTREGLMIYKGVNSDGSYYVYNPPLLYLPRTISIEETYTTNTTRTDYDAGGTPTGSAPFSMTLTLEAEEDMQVLAGNFSACLRLSGTENDEGVVSDLTLWLAYGTGEVKREFEDEERELISFTDRGTTYHPTD